MAARRTEAKSERRLEAAAAGIINSAMEGRILKVNRETEQIFAYPRAMLLSRTADDLLPEGLPTALNTGLWHGEMNLQDHNGTRH
ncbi:MAG: PAS domain-containing protein [Marinobacter sp.]